MTKRISIASLARLMAAAISSILLSGCVSAHLTHLDPSFTSSALKQGTLAIGGVVVTNTGEELSAREQSSIIDHFERQMKKRRPEIDLLMHKAVQTVLGEEVSSQITAAAATEETIAAPEQLAPLISKGANFVVFVVVTYNSVDRYVTSNTEVRNVYDDDMKVTGRTVKYFTIAQAKRSVTAEYRIFDLITGKRVWSSESSNSRSRRRIADSREGYPPAPEYGAAPTASSVVRSMTSASVKELPNPQKGPDNKPVVPKLSSESDE